MLGKILDPSGARVCRPDIQTVGKQARCQTAGGWWRRAGRKPTKPQFFLPSPQNARRRSGFFLGLSVPRALGCARLGVPSSTSRYTPACTQCQPGGICLHSVPGSAGTGRGMAVSAPSAPAHPSLPSLARAFKLPELLPAPQGRAAFQRGKQASNPGVSTGADTASDR